MAKKKNTPARPAAKPAGRTPTPVQTSAASGPMNVDLLEQLVRLMGENDLNTVDLRDGDKRVILRRGAAAPVYSPAPQQPQYSQAAQAAPSVPQAASTPAPAITAANDDAGLIAIKSPMVGTFYAKPSPEAKTFVSVGSVVGDDTDVCVIEAMKVFNNIKAEVKGTITKVLAEDGKPVEFGQVLFLVKP